MIINVDNRLTTSAAARIAQVSEQSVRNWLRSGRLAHDATPLGALIHADSLARLVAERNAAARDRKDPSV